MNDNNPPDFSIEIQLHFYIVEILFHNQVLEVK